MSSGIKVKRPHIMGENHYSGSKKIKLDLMLPLTLSNLPDCVLLHLLSYLDSTTLFQLSFTSELIKCILKRVNRRFSLLVQDVTLWKLIEARRNPNTIEKIKFCELQINKRTKQICFAGEYRSNVITNLDFLKDPNIYENLTVLALENSYLNGKEGPLSVYPRSLEELSFRRSYVSHNMKFFKYCSDFLTNLRVLLLDECQWVDTSMLMSIARLKELEILSLYKCRRRSSGDISYISLALTSGFKNLKILDLRFAGFGDLILKSLYSKPTLQEIYFQCYENTYRLEKYKRELEILEGKSQLDDICYLENEVDIDDSDLSFMSNYFGDGSYIEYPFDPVTDEGTSMYAYTKSKDPIVAVKSSRLYRSPYEKCSCKFNEKFWNFETDIAAPEQSSPCENNRSKNDSDIQLTTSIKTEDIPPHKLFRFVDSPNKKEDIDRAISKLKKKIDMLKLDPTFHPTYFLRVIKPCTGDAPPLDCIESTEENKSKDFLFVRDPINDYELRMFDHSEVQPDFNPLRVHVVRSNSDNPVIQNEHNYHILNENNVFVIEGNLRLNRDEGVSIANHVSIERLDEGSYARFERRIERFVESDRPKQSAVPAERVRETGMLLSVNEKKESKKKKKKSKVKDNSKSNKKIKVEANEKRNDNKKLSDENNKCNINSSDVTDENNVISNEKENKIVDDVKPGPSGILKPGPSSISAQDSCSISSPSKISLPYPNDISLPGPSGISKSSGSKENNCDKCKTNHITSTSSDEDDFVSKPCDKKEFRGIKRTRILKKGSRSTKKIKKDKENEKKPEDYHRGIEQDPCLHSDNIIVRIPNHRPMVIDVPDKDRPFHYFVGVPVNNPNIRINKKVNVRVYIGPSKQNREVSLTKLSLRGYKDVTDDTLTSINNLKLDVLDITNTSCTLEGIRNYVVFHPNCRVIHEKACVCGPKLHF